MSRRKKRKTPVTCVYCGDQAICTDEHVIPECLFPETSMPPKSDFVIVPACGPCNNRKAADDSYVRDLFIADIACDGNPTVLALLPAVIRSAEKNWSDFARVARRELRIEAVHSPGGIYLGHYLGVPITWERLKRFCTLVVRGLYWHASNERLPDDYVFEVFRLELADAAGLFRKWITHGGYGPFAIGTGVFTVTFITAPDDPFITVWLMQFYRSISIVVATAPKSFFDQFETPKGKRRFFGLG
jgi:hypothetical protein